MKRGILNQYCAWNWRLVPTWNVTTVNGRRQCACQKGVNCRKPGKHPRILSWQTQASSSWATVQSWHNMWPDANWGWLQDRTFALDIDVQRDGLTSLTAWRVRGDNPPEDTLTQETSSGGRHLIFHQPNDPLPSLGDFMPGIEVRGTGAYIMLYPSTGINGSWTWNDVTVDLPSQIRQCTDTLYSTIMLGNSSSSDASNDASSRLPSIDFFMHQGFGAYSGSRNVDAYRLMWRLLAKNDVCATEWSYERIAHTMRRIWIATIQGEHPFKWDECVECMRSAYKRRELQKNETKEQDGTNRKIAATLVNNPQVKRDND